MRHKYIRVDTLGFILFPADTDLWHLHVGNAALKASAGARIMSAGFAVVDKGLAVCSGGSESLGIRSRDDDSIALTEQLFGAEG